MSDRPKILLLDDEPDILELYTDLLAGLPSRPEVRTAGTGARAIAMLEAEPFSLLLCDLNMPGMDGLQVLTIVRRRFPQLRTVVMTAVTDEQFRHRAYALGLDLYLEKPNSPQATKLFLDCIESVLGRNVQDGFRGVQSKSLMDIIQLESLCQNSVVLRINAASREGRIWMANGEIIDAVTGQFAGEEAFRKILSWRAGNFEILPAEPNRPRRIEKTCQNLLLENAQAVDESQAPVLPGSPKASHPASPSEMLAGLSAVKGVEFLLSAAAQENQATAAWAVEEPDQVCSFTKQTLANFAACGDLLKAGQLEQVVGLGLQHHVALIGREDQYLCLGLQRALTAVQVQETINQVRRLWA